MIAVEVAYAPAPGVIDRVTVTLPERSTLREALQTSGLIERHGLDLATLSAGIWGRKETLDTALRERDRVEVYRPLQCDPKEARRLRYKQRGPAKKALSGSPPR